MTEKEGAAASAATLGAGRIRDFFADGDPRTILLLLAAIALLLLVLIGQRTARIAARAHYHDAAVHAQSAGTESGDQAHRPATVVKPVSCEKLPRVPGKSITTAIVEFPPGADSPRHRHPGSVTAFVLSGTLRSQLEGGPAGTYTAGQTWFEPPGAIHLFAENASSTEPAQLLATFVADDDCGPLTVPEPSPRQSQ